MHSNNFQIARQQKMSSDNDIEEPLPLPEKSSKTKPFFLNFMLINEDMQLPIKSFTSDTPFTTIDAPNSIFNYTQ